jgi:hypothetical protein
MNPYANPHVHTYRVTHRSRRFGYLMVAIVCGVLVGFFAVMLWWVR